MAQIITKEMREAAFAAGARVATAAYLEVRGAVNANFKEGACTYGEMKAALNEAAYVMNEVRKMAGLEPWVVAGGEKPNADTV